MNEPLYNINHVVATMSLRAILSHHPDTIRYIGKVNFSQYHVSKWLPKSLLEGGKKSPTMSNTV